MRHPARCSSSTSTRPWRTATPSSGSSRTLATVAPSLRTMSSALRLSRRREVGLELGVYIRNWMRKHIMKQSTSDLKLLFDDGKCRSISSDHLQCLCLRHTSQSGARIFFSNGSSWIRVILFNDLNSSCLFSENFSLFYRFHDHLV